MNRRSPLERGEERKKKNTFAFIVDLFLSSLQAFTQSLAGFKRNKEGLAGWLSELERRPVHP